MRYLPIGAELVAGGGVHFRTWAPSSGKVFTEQYVIGNPHPVEVAELSADGGGYFSGLIPEFAAGGLYKYRLDSGSFPDPVSRYQPLGPHGPSQVIHSTVIRRMRTHLSFHRSFPEALSNNLSDGAK